MDVADVRPFNSVAGGSGDFVRNPSSQAQDDAGPGPGSREKKPSKKKKTDKHVRCFRLTVAVVAHRA